MRLALTNLFVGLCTALVVVPGANAAPAAPDVQSLARDRGITTEQASARLDLQNKVVDSAQKVAASVGPDALAGQWLDSDGMPHVAVTVTGNEKDQLAARVKSVLNNYGVPAADVTVDQRPFTLAQLKMIQADIDAQLRRALGVKATVTTSVREDRGTVDVNVPSGAVAVERAIATAAAARYGARVALSAVGTAPTQDDCTNSDCDKPLRGGVRIFNSSFVCTAGFNARNRSTNAPIVLTAGHCNSGGATWNANSLGSAISIGTFVSSAADSRGDSGAISDQFPSYWDPRPWVLVTDSSQTTRNPQYTISAVATTPLSGTYICKGGAVLGYTSCGTVRSRSATNGAVTGLISATYCRAGGDSGGPVFANGTAYGLHEGTLTGDKCDQAVFEPIVRALDFNNASLF